MIFTKNTIKMALIFVSVILMSVVFSLRAAAIGNVATIRVNVFQVYVTQQFSSSQNFSQFFYMPQGTVVHMDMPQNFLSTSSTLKMEFFAQDKATIVENAPLPSGKLGAKTFYNINFQDINNNFNPVTQFDKPITLTFNYTDDDIAGMDESNLTVNRWDGSAWVSLAQNVIDATQNKITASTAYFSNFAILSTPATASSPSQAGSGTSGGSSGGGGGGGSAPAPPPIVTQAVFRGKAYPGSKVTLLKDGQLVVSVPASPDANFEIALSGLAAGIYNFGVYAEDSRARRSIAHTFSISITGGVTTVISGIFIPPTIALDKTEVKKGDILTIFGQSAPKAGISVVISSAEPMVKKTSADNSGAWAYKLDTLELDYGDHLARARAAKDGDISTFSHGASFKVGTKTVASKKPPSVLARADLSKDGRVNLVDFSILAFWHKRPLTEKAKSVVDLNGDGKVTLADFSILAYYWTG